MHLTARRRVQALVATALSGAALLAGCTTASEASDRAQGQASTCPVGVNNDVRTTVRIAYQAIPNGDLIVRDRGWLEACLPHATITWSKFDSGGDVIQAFGSGSVDLGLVGSSPATKAVSAPLNIDLQVVWIHDVIGDAESLVAQHGITSIKQLAGHTVAVPFASTAHFSLLSALKDAGLVPGRDLHLINLSPDAMLAAWQRGEIDAAWVWAPTLTTLKESGTVLLSSKDTAARGKPTFDLAAATRTFITGNREFMKVWTALENKAVDQIKTNRQAAVDSIAVQLGTNPAEVAGQLKGYIYLTAKEQAGEPYFGGGMARALIATAKFLATQDEIAEVAPAQKYEDAIYREAVDQVAAG